MLSSIPKLNKTAKEVILLQKKTSVLYFTTVQCLCSCESVIYLHSGIAATEHAQTTVRQPKERRSSTTTINRRTRRLISKLNLVTFLGLGFGQKFGWEMGFGQNLGWEMGFIPPPSGPSWSSAVYNDVKKSYIKCIKPGKQSTIKQSEIHRTHGTNN